MSHSPDSTPNWHQLFTVARNVLSKAKDAYHHTYVTAYMEIGASSGGSATRVLIARCDGGFDFVSDSTLRELRSVIGDGARSDECKTSGDAFLIFGADAQIWVRYGGLKMPSAYCDLKASRLASRQSSTTTLENTLRSIVEDIIRDDDAFLRMRGAVLFPVDIARQFSKSIGEKTVEPRVVVTRYDKGIRVVVDRLAMCSLGALTRAARVVSETTPGTAVTFSVDLRNRTAIYRFDFTDRPRWPNSSKRTSSNVISDGAPDMLKRQRTRDGVADENADA
ncbi:hypothetical protein CYMTET_3502 [Cymbomonas tetramitiformis]|uniref:Uncharacterized protein n=1 Tax=Cymbomonas tetramitiformis TaxID=36881 RepID=A0AAE0LKS5_9CHLO|nr:hypothetical protein CYMTET_3502 [Cymbomonas tetramitiformis]